MSKTYGQYYNEIFEMIKFKDPKILQKVIWEKFHRKTIFVLSIEQLESIIPDIRMAYGTESQGLSD